MHSNQTKASRKKNRVGRALSLLIASSLPIFFQSFRTQQNLELPYPPELFVLISVFGLIVATICVSMDKALDSALLSHKGWLERMSQTTITVSLLAVAYACAEPIPEAANKLEELAIGFFYVINLLNLFFAEFIVTLANSEKEITKELDPAILANQNLYTALQWSTVPILLSIVITFCIYFLFGYDSTVPNHLTVFASITGILLAIAGKIE